MWLHSCFELLPLPRQVLAHALDQSTDPDNTAHAVIRTASLLEQLRELFSEDDFFFFNQEPSASSCKYIPADIPATVLQIQPVWIWLTLKVSIQVHMYPEFFSCSQVNRDRALHLSALLMRRPHKAVIANDEIHSRARPEQVHVLKMCCFWCMQCLSGAGGAERRLKIPALMSLLLKLKNLSEWLHHLISQLVLRVQTINYSEQKKAWVMSKIIIKY